MMKKLMFAAMVAMAFAACSDEKPMVEEVEYEVIDFEQAELGDDGFIWGKSQATEQDDTDYTGAPIRSNIFHGPIYEEAQAQFYTYYSDCGHTIDTWNGFVISNHTDRQTEDYTNDKSVYAEGGANGSKQFAVGYYGAWTPDDKGIPVVRFSSPTTIHSVAVALPTYVYHYFTKSIATAEKPDYVLVVTGVDGAQKWTVRTPLVSGQKVQNGWMTVDMSGMLPVSMLTFTIECSDEMAPLYVCVDDLTYEK